VVDVNREMTAFALDVVGRTIFDADVESEAPEVRAVLEAGMRVFHRFLLPGAELLWNIPLPATRRFNVAKSDIDDYLEGLIAERAALDPPGAGLLDHLLSLRAEDGGRLLTDAEIRDEAITLMLAGHETTAQALTWTWHLLAVNPDAAAQLRAELERVLRGGPPRVEHYEQLAYTQAVFKESLRLYPPVWALARIATRPYMLGEHDVPEGGTLILPQWVVHRDPRHHADAGSFRPERWLAGAPPVPGSYFPFAAGTRMCIGERFAMLEGTMALAVLAPAWRVSPFDRRPAPDARFTLRPHGGMDARTERLG
jgi:cytochrome P450